MFKKYIVRPRVLYAVRFTEANKNMVFNSLTGNYCHDFEDGKPILKVTTVHGETAIVRVGDWVVKDINIGTYYPVKNEIFVKNNELHPNQDNDIIFEPQEKK